MKFWGFTLLVSGYLLGIMIWSVNNWKDSLRKNNRLNVLFIIVDDLRPALGCYGDKLVVSKNIDQLASRSIKFNEVYAQQALCSPSRTSFLTSRRPDTLNLYENKGYHRKIGTNFTTIPQYFKENGYHTVSVGKVFHPENDAETTDDYPYSWSTEPYHPRTEEYKNAKVCPPFNGRLESVINWSCPICHSNLVCPVDVQQQPYHTLPDMEITEYAINFLKKYDDYQEPFFLAVGYHKPHIPFKFPKEYVELYPLESIPLAHGREWKNMVSVAWNPWMDVRSRDDVKELDVPIPFGHLPEDFQYLAIQGYYASVTYVDDQVGKLLQALHAEEYARRTMIVFVSDHGWSLGEHEEWAKYSNFDVAVHTPLLIYIPGVTDENAKNFEYMSNLNTFISKNMSQLNLETDKFVELVDLFPTLAQYADLPLPPLCLDNSSETMLCTEGVSLKPLIDFVIKGESGVCEGTFTWKNAVFSQYPRPSLSPQNNSDSPVLEDITIMGYSIKTNNFHYTEWIKFNDTFGPLWNEVYKKELYDIISDPLETLNIANYDAFSQAVKELSYSLHLGWRSALPLC